MSDKILKFKIRKTIKEYDFLKSEYDYINEISNVADVEFIESINDYLNKRPALKDIYYSKENKLIESNLKRIKNEKEESNNKDKETNNEKKKDSIGGLNKKKSNKSRYLYRQIVKLTHPDKVEDKNLNEIYIMATNSYNEDDAAALYVICDELGIEFGVNEEDLLFFDKNIHRIKGEINLIKGTFAYNWSQAIDNKEKELLILKFIKLKIS